uniref:Pectin acetylesterase n=2 Tax=Nelumbo nucifera TaxID=4432 RepID=A0A822XXA4_NELNU|nr:TPA_asm: hypothetical protein HUJ06_026421 [Nelumbo nucifera]DAD24993.1 TPA_asm: hypothetical protein HUJ06_026457 [Nelumbo nucifera]
MVYKNSGVSLFLLIWTLVIVGANGYFVGITYVDNAVAKGAVCLDGSPPAYHMAPGFGSGVNNWLILLEGGAWCNNATTCLARKNTRLGSSKEMVKQLSFSGFLSDKEKFNPDFFNWNKVKVRYCDGSSFTGDVEAVDPATNLYYRGQRIFNAVVDDLLEKGMKNAQNALLSGCSAGGLSVILHCDKFRELLPQSTKVKCMADAGFFINAKTIAGTEYIKEFFSDVVTTHQSAKNLPASCTSKGDSTLCFFPQNVAPQVTTPLFILNAAYDSYQVKNILAPGIADPHGTWHDCKLDITKCSDTQLQAIQGFRKEFLNAIKGVEGSPTKGLFINSCYSHCQSGMQETWLREDSPVLDNMSISKAVGDWYFDRGTVQKIEQCEYPCDKSCHNRVFTD